MYRQSTDEYVEMDVERRMVENPTVEYELLDAHAGYISLSSFESSIYTFFTTISGRFKTSSFVLLNINGDKNILESSTTLFLSLVSVKLLILLYIQLSFWLYKFKLCHISSIRIFNGVPLRINQIMPVK